LTRAVATSREQGARLFELRAAASLARVLQARGQSTDAKTLLGAAISSIPDQTSTPDLDDARQLLRAL
jgi:predicted ATPase